MKNTTSEEGGKRTLFLAILIIIVAAIALFVPMPPAEIPVMDEPISLPHLIEEAEAAEPKIVMIATTSNHVVEADEMVVEKTVDIPNDLKVICSCESGGHPHKDKNGVLLAGFVDSDDKGECQINTRYHAETMNKMGLDIENDNDYYTYAVHLYKTQGRQPWSASASCWAPIIGYQ